MLDIVFRNARVIDGSGNVWFKADVAVAGDKIGPIARRVPEQGHQEIDVEGLVICPGFIDVHTHSDLSLLTQPGATHKITQGVTTEVVGQDGIAAAPIDRRHRVSWASHIAGADGRLDREWDWETVGEYLSRLDGKTATNVATLIPLGNVRLNAMGMRDGTPTSEEMAQMKASVAEGMKQGALGVSTGLIYPPCQYAATGELVALCQVAAKQDGILSIHMRSEATRVMEALEEALSIGLKSGIPVHVSHLKAFGRPNWGKVTKMLERIDAARDGGLDVTCDQYPYTAGSSMLGSLLPPWVFAGELDRAKARVVEPATRCRIRAELACQSPEWDNLLLVNGIASILITSVRTDGNKRFEGQRLVDIASARGEDAYDALLNLVVEEDFEVSMAMFGMDEKDVETVMQSPIQMFATDGLPGSKPHPRLYGTYPRVLGRYVRERSVLELPEAIRKMTSFPAQRLGLAARGLLREGLSADIVVFDPETVIDKATFEDPCQLSQGIRHVLVNGKPVVKDGVSVTYDKEWPGRVLTREGS
jgi:N-acyl-D-amino-acid deacylase